MTSRSGRAIRPTRGMVAEEDEPKTEYEPKSSTGKTKSKTSAKLSSRENSKRNAAKSSSTITQEEPSPPKMAKTTTKVVEVKQTETEAVRAKRTRAKTKDDPPKPTRVSKRTGNKKEVAVVDTQVARPQRTKKIVEKAKKPDKIVKETECVEAVVSRRSSRRRATDKEEEEKPVTKETRASTPEVCKSPAKKSTRVKKRAGRSAKPLKAAEIASLLDNDDDDFGDEEVVSDVDEVSFKTPLKTTALADRTNEARKTPVYKRFFEELPQKKDTKTKSKKAAQKQSEMSVYDLDAYEDEFGTEDDNKKVKKKRKRAKKQKADIILTFGSGQKTKVAPVLKQMKNLKTPVPHKKPEQQHQQREQQQSSVGFSRDCDEFFPSVDAGYNGDDDDPFVQDEVVVSVTSPSPNKEQAMKIYTTPAIPKRVAKGQQGKVSTPRLDEESNKRTQPVEVTVKDQVKQCFGFLTDEDNDTDNESLMGISPVKRSSMLSKNGFGMGPSTSFLSPSSTIGTSTRLTGSFLKPTLPAARPTRFTVVRPTVKASVNKKPFSSIVTSTAARKRPEKQTENVEQEQNEQTVDDNVDGKAIECNVSIFEEALINDDCDEEKEPEQEPVAAVLEEEVIEMEQQKNGEEDLNVTKEQLDPPNAYDVLSGKTTLQRKDSVKETKGNKKVKGKRQAGTTKQALIYEKVKGGKQVKSKKRQPVKQKQVVSSEASESDENRVETVVGSPMKQVTNTVSRTYSKKPLNTSVTASPNKRCTKREKQISTWASLQTSHFSEIEDFDLSFA